MTGTVVPEWQGVRVFPPPPRGFDALAASETDLARHGIPPRPDPRTQPERAAQWEQLARRYGGFEHLAPQLIPADTPATPATVEPLAVLPDLEACGYSLASEAPFTQLSATWTVPNLNYTPTPQTPDGLVHFRTFFGLGFLDVHVEMTVDAAQNVTSVITIHTGAQVALPVRPGDAISALLCLNPNPPGTAAYFLANERTSQTVNFAMDTGFPPGRIINAGISRGYPFPNPLAGFGVVYFDEIVAFTTEGTRLLTDGLATRMVDTPGGSTLATPVRLYENAFRVDSR
jgi:Peptidase A4 family